MKSKNTFHFIVFCLLSGVSSYNTFASIPSTQSQWNGNLYAKHSQSQSQDAMNLLKKIEFRGNERILDLGCGDGRLALLLANSYPQAYLLGIDPSPSMINAAQSKTLPKNIDFRVESAETFSLNEKFDVVLSVHAMHWIKEQEKALKNIYAHLKPHGKMYLVFAPSKEGLLFNTALKKVMARWQDEFLSFKNNQYFYDLETYRKLLVSSGFQVKNLSYILNTREYKDMISLESWVKQWLPHYKFLSDDKREIFLKDLMEAYALEINVVPNQTIKWNEYVIQIEALKPGENSLSL